MFHLFGLAWSCVVVLPAVPGFAISFTYSLPSLPVNLNTTLVGLCFNLLLSSSHTLLTGIFIVNPVVVVWFAVTSSLVLVGVSYSICPVTAFLTLVTSLFIPVYTTFIVLFTVTSFVSVNCIFSTGSSHVIVLLSALYVPPAKSDLASSIAYGNLSTNTTFAFPL